MSDFDAVLEIKKNLLEELLRDSKTLGIDVKEVVEGRLRVVNDMQETLENTEEYKSFIESVKKNLTLENPLVQNHEPERDAFYEEKDDDGKIIGWEYHISDREALELAKDDLLADRNDFEEFITGDVPEYLDLLKVIIERAL